jgi:adenine deaminase
LKRGCLASSIAHDSHNIVAVGTSDRDLYCAIKEIERLGGGIVAIADGKTAASLPLPVAGLLSDEPLEKVTASMERLEEAAAQLGCCLPRPFATLSLITLPVIPEIRISDLGIIDVDSFKVIR